MEAGRCCSVHCPPWGPWGLPLHTCHTDCPESVELVCPVASTGCSVLARLVPFPLYHRGMSQSPFFCSAPLIPCDLFGMELGIGFITNRGNWLAEKPCSCGASEPQRGGAKRGGPTAAGGEAFE